LSLGAIDFGILIDGSVVLMENIVCRLSRAGDGADRLRAVKEASLEVAGPVLCAVLIITVVYLPILTLPGVSGKTFHPMALTVVFGLITALAIALFVTPSLSYFMLARKTRDHDSFFMGVLRSPYRHMLLMAVRRPLVISLMAIAIFAASLFCLPLLGSEFIPVLREGAMVLTINRPMSASLQTADQQTTLVERELKKIPEVDRVVSRTGHSEIAFDPMGTDETDTFVILKDRSSWRPAMSQMEVEAEVSRCLRERVPGLCFSISQPIEQRMNEMIAGSKGDIAIRIFGPDMDELRRLGTKVAGVLAKVKGTADLKLEQTVGLPVVTASLDSTALAGYGVRAQDALDAISAARDGKVVGTIFEGKPRFDLAVRFDPESMPRADELAALPVAMSGGDLVPLGQIARIVRNEGAAQISHRNGDRYFTVQANVRERDLGSFVEEAQPMVDKLSLPSGYRIEWGGQFENLKVARERLSILVPLSLLLIFVLLYVQFDSVKPGLLVFMNVPLAFSGGIFALLLRGMPLSVTAGVGFIALFGVAVMNGVVLVSTIRSMEKEQGLGPRQAALLAARRRLRPVLMTAMVASFGFLPMALADSVGAEVQRPLATVVIGGLITSTVLTLIVLPAVYSLFRQRLSSQPRLRA
ncbi:MAG: efflux RND transporter permease subunit, partial [Cyanobacteria bacterium HKST-UBA02]|nr:efflux RND transporter permease subunit [Cyanobacteria bacterium HKST-UBA02]